MPQDGKDGAAGWRWAQPRIRHMTDVSARRDGQDGVARVLDPRLPLAGRRRFTDDMLKVASPLLPGEGGAAHEARSRPSAA